MQSSNIREKRRERPEVPQAEDSSSRSSSSSESSTDTEMSLVDVCTFLGVNADQQDRVTVKPVAVAEGREGGPISLDLTKWEFSKSRLPDQMQKID